MDLLRGAAAALSLLFALPVAAVQLPTLWVWPGDLCSATLQECIDGTAPGDIVLVATNGPIDESITITGALDLAAAGGFYPTFSASQFITARSSSSGDQRISIRGLRLDRGFIRVYQQSTGTLTAEVRDNTVTALDNGFPAIWIDGSIGPVSASVSGNTLEVLPNSAGQQTGIAVTSSLAAHATIDHNLVHVQAGSQAMGIAVSGQADAAFDVIANRISGVGYNEGIDVSQSGSGTITARILDNLVTGQANQSGVPGALVLYSGSSSGLLDVTVVNNTFPYDDTAIASRIDPPATASVRIANNVFTGNSSAAMHLSGLVDGASLTQDYNLFFANGTDIAANPSATPGPHSVFANPHYAASGNYRLLDPSPAADAGDDAAVPADLLTDLDGNARVARSHVDIGAYEVPEPDAAPAAATAAISAAWAAARRRRARALERRQRGLSTTTGMSRFVPAWYLS